MWTPRRILLLLAALCGFSAVYFGYAGVLGGIDGLPDLPKLFLERLDDRDAPIPSQPVVTAAEQRLQEAFGHGSPEVTNTVAYQTRLEVRDKGTTFACGPLKFKSEPSEFVEVAPFSVALFSKPKPPSARTPGEVVEISTIHADKAVLQYDRKITGVPDIMNGKAKLVGIELVSLPDHPSPDPRRGHVWMTNNQRSADPNDYLVFKTPGPLFYRTADAAPAVDAPQIWTAAAVQVTDRKNLPRPLRSHAGATVPASPDHFRGRNAVANILLGLTSPPPTMTAEGMKVYLLPDEKKGGSGYGGVKTIELTENVQVSLWSAGGGGFPGGGDAPAKPAVDPPAAAGAAAGGLADAFAVARRLNDQSLLVINTLGRFRYDYPTSTARFEAAAAANPALPNHVNATRQSADGGTDDLICKALEIRFGDAKAAKGDAGMKIKGLTATGDHVFLSVEAEQLSAQGTELRYEATPTGSVTVLRGSPVNALRERNQISGTAGKATEIRIVATDPPAGSKDKRQSVVGVYGPGRLDLFDPASNGTTVQATWGTSLTQEKQVIGGKEQDLLKFEGGGSFADTKGGMSLAADKLWLWLGAADGDAPPPPSKTGQPAVKPQQLVATGRVRTESDEFRVRDTDQLTVYFRDVAPRLPPADPTPVAAAPAPQPVAATPVPPAPAAEPQKKPADKPKQPMYLSARDIKSWVIRYPAPTAGPKPTVNSGGTGGLKYELERAYCEDRVKVHQPPADPTKAKRGVDILGSKLNLDQSPAGGVLTVTGSAEARARVYFEDMEIDGPVVKIDQPQNSVAVDGEGELTMPGGNDPNASDRANGKANELKVRWATEMRFNGAMATADFLGMVYAKQEPPAADSPRRPAALLASKSATAEPRDETVTRSVLVCHRLDVTFDRPVYFNQHRGTPPPAAPGQPAPTGTAAKIRTAVCTPVADDEAERVKAAGALDPRQVVFFEDVIGPGGRVVRAHRVLARELTVTVDGRKQQMRAAGPGEVRILQLGAKDQAAPGQQPPAGQKAEEEMKLTVVNYPARMDAQDTRLDPGFFQEATFHSGARVVQVPADDLNLDVSRYEADPPQRGIALKCQDVLKVSSTRTRRDGPADQKLSAEGNAMFVTDEYQGLAARITHNTDAAILYGDRNRTAKLQQRVGGGNGQETIGETIIYAKDGTIKTDNGIGGTFAPGR